MAPRKSANKLRATKKTGAKMPSAPIKTNISTVKGIGGMGLIASVGWQPPQK